MKSYDFHLQSSAIFGSGSINSQIGIMSAMNLFVSINSMAPVAATTTTRTTSMATKKALSSSE